MPGIQKAIDSLCVVEVPADKLWAIRRKVRSRLSTAIPGMTGTEALQAECERQRRLRLWKWPESSSWVAVSQA